MPDLSKKIEKREYLPLRNWLQDKIHSVGRGKSAKELLHDICKEELSHRPLMDYLENKYKEIYRW